MESQLLTVKIGPYLWGAPVTHVTEILASPGVTPIPQTPPAIAGVAVIRGQALTVLTLRPMLNLASDAVGMALRWGSQRGSFLVAVDQVEGLWAPTEPMHEERWSGLVSPAVAPLVKAAYRWDSEWLWEWIADMPDRLHAGLLTDPMLADR
ncbi:chemotaxis protein CheW [Sulfobacillus harzensis]|uniref:Chemotaxis protein CheW n=1 Tax=Sulfobacillus harzensis TaxID=2729629 RepID=A0A7Y0L9C5_9FIRM|nr:chemotaxis protein CheW [Sulfobacillus harzensis]NMP24339.1 chemotaxis protein CheW [Sulfobacillus harzensis]